MILYHVTTQEHAAAILEGGFRDGTGTYMTDQTLTGVFLSDRPLDENEGACGGVVLEVDLAADENELADRELIEDGKGYREWIVPAALINGRAQVRLSNAAE
jgi:hypothetical protein